MFAVDDAERRGDAQRALRLMGERPMGPDGTPFWRPWRVERLTQVEMLGSALPRWAVSRWIAAQAHETLGGPGDRRRKRCEELALEIRGGLGGLSVHGDQDARCKLMDRDWIYRQLLLYELGGLSEFVRRHATPDLLAGSDRIHDWAKAPMSALRLVGRDAGTVIWEHVDSAERLELPNIGTAAMVVPGEHVLSRLVPIEAGVVLEGAPLVVPEGTAQQVAVDPSRWMEAIAASRDDIVTSGFEQGLVSDVRQLAWQFVLLEPSHPVPVASRLDAYLARRALALARECLEESTPPEEDEIDLWACLRAAVLNPPVVTRLLSVAKRGDRSIFEALSQRLAPPADVVCRRLMADLASAA
jgi:hypothetical protein